MRFVILVLKGKKNVLSKKIVILSYFTLLVVQLLLKKWIDILPVILSSFVNIVDVFGLI